MYKNNVFTQISQFISPFKFRKISVNYGNERYAKKLNGFDHFKILLLVQIKGLSSLRDIESRLKQTLGKIYHLGLKNDVKRSTLSDANNKRNNLAFREVFFEVLKKCHSYSPKHSFKFNNKLLSIDSSTISLCLSLCQWAKHRKTKSAVKIHAVLNASGKIPEYIVLKPAKQHDVKAAKAFPTKLFKPGTIIAMDRAYIDYRWLARLNKKGVSFISRAKSNMNYKVVSSLKVLKSKGILKDQTIKLTGFYKSKDYPATLRLVKYKDQETGKIYEYITNNFDLCARTIADCYKNRWEIELFFKWIKQNLKIKKFLGNSQNAIYSQIWVALIYYLILSYLKHKHKWAQSILDISRVIKEIYCEAMDLSEMHDFCKRKLEKWKNPNQTYIFNQILTGH